MFHYTNQNTTLSSSHRLKNSTTSGGSGSKEVYFHPYDGGGVPARASTSASTNSGFPSSSQHQYQHQRSTSSEFNYSCSDNNLHQWDEELHGSMTDTEDDITDEDEEDEPMDILYEQEVNSNGGRRLYQSAGNVLDAAYRTGSNQHEQRRHHSEPIINSTNSNNLELQLSTTADHIMSLLQREANDYSVPLPIRYYPTEFTELDSSSSSSNDDKSDSATKKGSKSNKTSIGPWRKRISSWMYDVVDHFQYDRNVVSVALRYIDQYVGHLLVEHDSKRRVSGISSSSSSQPIKRRHFQLIAVTSLYLAIKIHGELMENDPVSGDEYNVVTSLIYEVDGRAFLGKPLDKALDPSQDKDDPQDNEDVDHESDEDLRFVSNKLSELRRKQKKGRWSRLGFGNNHSSIAPESTSSSRYNTSKSSLQPKAPNSGLPYKPRKRGMLSGPLRLHSFVELSRGLFTSRDITDTETKILKALNYVVNPPTSRRFVGELLRMLALCFEAGMDGAGMNVHGMISAAESMLGIDRKEILERVLTNACGQIEGAASVPSLSIGCLPSVLAYGAMVNAVEEEFDKLFEEGVEKDEMDAIMELEKDDMVESSPQLEDFQRHYRRYSRNTSPSPAAKPTNVESDKELFLEAWKEQFLVTVFHATNCFLSPESQDIFKVRELLLDQVSDKDGEDGTNASSPGSSSPTSKDQGIKKRSPRSPRSVANGNSPNRQMLRGGSFFRQGSSFSSTTSLLSPYDARGRSSFSSGVHTMESASPSFRNITQANAPTRRSYHKQTSEPITFSDVPSMSNRECVDAATRYKRFASQSESSRRSMSASNFGSTSWRRESFQPPNPSGGANPLFSA